MNGARCRSPEGAVGYFDPTAAWTVLASARRMDKKLASLAINGFPDPTPSVVYFSIQNRPQLLLGCVFALLFAYPDNENRDTRDVYVII